MDATRYVWCGRCVGRSVHGSKVLLIHDIAEMGKHLLNTVQEQFISILKNSWELLSSASGRDPPVPPQRSVALAMLHHHSTTS
jgi:hypothetical protein